MEEMRTINWGIAAAGRITHDFVTALSTIENSSHVVVAVADVELPRAKEFADIHGIPKYYDGFDELSKDEDVQIVYVGTLNPFHYTVVRLMLERGKHVLCETPMCLYHEQAQELYTMSRVKGLFLMEGMWSRFFPSYQRLRELLSSADTIGDVTRIQVRHGFRAESIDRIWTRDLGGSITLDIGIYALQLGQFVFGTSPTSIEAEAILNDDGVDVETEFILDYGGNRRLEAFITGLDDLKNVAKITGTKGRIRLNNYWCCDGLISPVNNIERWPLPAAKFELNQRNSCGLRYEAEEVRKCLESGLLECPLYTHAESLELIHLGEEIRRRIGVVYD